LCASFTLFLAFFFCIFKKPNISKHFALREKTCFANIYQSPFDLPEKKLKPLMHIFPLIGGGKPIDAGGEGLLNTSY
jgi:hypothetical protein